MRRLLRWMLSLLLLVGLWVALVLSEWLPRPTAEEQAALAALAEEPESARGARNGFAATWFLGFDVPEDQLDELLEADLAAYNQQIEDTGSVVDFRTTAEGRFAIVASPANKDPALCELWKDDCIPRVRADREATRQRLQDFSKRLERSRWLARYDHFNYAFTSRYDSPIPGIGGISTLQLSEAALQFVDGKVEQAFATLCQDAASWRRFRSRSNILVNDMVGVAHLSTAAQLYGGMLAEQSAEFAAPCPEVFAPLTNAELDQCAVMRFEFVSSQNSLDAEMPWMITNSAFARAMHKLLNRQHFARRLALAIGPYCQAEQRERDASRDPTPPAVENGCSPFAWPFDPFGCALIESATPDFHVYHLRVLDLDARLRLLNAAIWLRNQPTAAAGDQQTLLGDQGFAARPKDVDSPQHEFTWDADRGLLRLRNLEKGRGEYWEVPVASIPGSTEPPQ